jgi:hypothetical protein
MAGPFPGPDGGQTRALFRAGMGKTANMYIGIGTLIIIIILLIILL